MDILIDNEGYQWRIRGDSTQVTVERRSPDAKKSADHPDSWLTQSYHNRIDHALSWLLDQLVRIELEGSQADDFVALVSSMREAIDRSASVWRSQIQGSA
jgi:hypothetical protein